VLAGARPVWRKNSPRAALHDRTSVSELGRFPGSDCGAGAGHAPGCLTRLGFGNIQGSALARPEYAGRHQKAVTGLTRMEAGPGSASSAGWDSGRRGALSWFVCAGTGVENRGGRENRDPSGSKIPARREQSVWGC